MRVPSSPSHRKEWWGELGRVVPGDLLREEPVVAGAAGDLRPGAGVAEAVRQPDAARFDAELLLEVAAAVGDLADQGLAVGQVAVRLDPHAADGDEAALGDALLHAREKLGAVLLQPGVLLGGAHRVLELRILVHEGEGVGDGAGHLAAGLAHRPQPCGVDVRVADGADAHGRGVGRPGEHAGEFGARLLHGVGMLLVEGVEGALKGLGQLEVAGGLLVRHVVHESLDGVEVQPVVLKALVVFGQVGAAEHVLLLRLAGGAFAQLGLDERDDAEQQRVAGGLQVHGEGTVGGDVGVRGAVGVEEGHPVVARMHGLDDGAVRAVHHALDVAADRVVVPAQVEEQLQRAALRVAGGHAAGQAEPGGAPGGAPFRAEFERLERNLAAAEAGEELRHRHRIAGDVEGLHRQGADRGVDAGTDALADDAGAALQLLVDFQEHAFPLHYSWTGTAPGRKPEDHAARLSDRDLLNRFSAYYSRSSPLRTPPLRRVTSVVPMTIPHVRNPSPGRNPLPHESTVTLTHSTVPPRDADTSEPGGHIHDPWNSNDTG